MMFWYDREMGWWGIAGMGIGMVMFWVLLIAAILALVIYLLGDRTPGQVPPSDAPSAEQILAARFARGEISETEYRDRMSVLGDHVQS